MNGPLAGFEERRLAELKEHVAERASRPRWRSIVAFNGDRTHPLRARTRAALTGGRRIRIVPSLLAAAAAAAAAVVMVMSGTDAPLARPDVTPQTRPVSAQAVLRHASLVVQRRRPIVSPGPRQWIYRRTVVQEPGGSGTVKEYWTRFDGREQIRRQGQGPLETSAYVPDPADDDLTPQEFAAKLAALPTDPHKLLAQVKADRFWAPASKGEGGLREQADDRAFRVLSVYLDQEVPLPPELHAAIFRALAEIPGVRVDAGVRDAAGRPGIGIAYEPGPAQHPGRYDKNGRLLSRSYLIVDPMTYEYLGRRVEQFQDEIIDGQVANRAGTVPYLSAELARGIVNRLGEPPR